MTDHVHGSLDRETVKRLTAMYASAAAHPTAASIAELDAAGPRVDVPADSSTSNEPAKPETAPAIVHRDVKPENVIQPPAYTAPEQAVPRATETSTHDGEGG